MYSGGTDYSGPLLAQPGESTFAYSEYLQGLIVSFKHKYVTFI